MTLPGWWHILLQFFTTTLQLGRKLWPIGNLPIRYWIGNILVCMYYQGDAPAIILLDLQISLTWLWIESDRVETYSKFSLVTSRASQRFLTSEYSTDYKIR